MSKRNPLGVKTTKTTYTFIDEEVPINRIDFDGLSEEQQEKVDIIYSDTLSTNCVRMTQVFFVPLSHIFKIGRDKVLNDSSVENGKIKISYDQED